METHPAEPSERAPKWTRRKLALIGAGALLVTGIVAGYQSFYPQPDQKPIESSAFEREYPLHENITATVFWAGESADSSNDFIHNRSSAWTSDWVTAYGGVDNPENRCGYKPCDFTPMENPFYFALPFGDRTEKGLKSADQLKVVPWYSQELAESGLLLKNRWIEITHKDKTAYAQWEDVGPFNENDAAYVFGSQSPQETRAGLDLSPAVADYLQIDGRAVVSWGFVDEDDVPDGEWTKTITRSTPHYQ